MAPAAQHGAHGEAISKAAGHIARPSFTELASGDAATLRTQPQIN
eukprot:CAMPEP_0177203546 /NCGR_PEP_ID=MMETSP0367-20130122/27871_1 /TAXON_ID=447022 ORGANISM="Scrippsiella hangoei-like, Strain SHHI-4" /NCGR_SAMPLE_ID=MMETSP0367 /ASSEMBLY_ACC=CAM_ASM_000362 /LENGTH=44 /DNA_ID= /DNA_START= /DNA_END= /DNA_ORIENTATION=